MKRFFSLFLTFLILLIFSCKGTPKPEDAPPDLSGIEETSQEDESSDSSEEVAEDSPEDSFEDPSEISFGDEEETAEEVEDDDEITFLLMEETTGGDSDETALSEAIETDATDQLFELTETDTPAEEIEQVVQTSPDPAPVVVPRQPPLPPPALLGPAEEKPEVREPSPSVTQSEPAQSEPPQSNPPVVSAVRDTPSPLWSELTTPQSGEIIYSRIIRCTVGQMVEIPFRGTGWVYLGELASRRGIVYDSRRLDPDGQTFLFRAEEAGTYSLKFFKQDFIRDYILNDFVQVIVGDAPTAAGSGWFNPPFDRGRVTAEPRWPSALEEAEIQRRAAAGTRPPASTPVYTPSAGESAASQAAAPQSTTPTQATSATQEAAVRPPAVPADIVPPIAELPADAIPEPVEKMPPEEILEKAQKSFDDGNVSSAIALLDLFREYYPAGSDELYWLYGQFYEANTPSRDILLSLDYYRRLTNEYPQSRWFNDARRRIAYLERFYINIQ